MKKQKNVLYTKEIGNAIESIFDLVDDAYSELKQKKVVVSRAYINQASDFHGIYIYPVSDQFHFFTGIWLSYYSSTGIPLCLGIDYDKKDMKEQMRQEMKKLIAKEKSLYECKVLFDAPVCGIKADKVNELTRHGAFADYLLQLVKKTGYSLKLK